VLFVVTADDAKHALSRVLRNERRAVECAATYLGLKGTDELAYAEDAWAMQFLDANLFRRNGGSIAIDDANASD
jgi:hypothetical protein